MNHEIENEKKKNIYFSSDLNHKLGIKVGPNAWPVAWTGRPF
jgi:hypothetical protein